MLLNNSIDRNMRIRVIKYLVSKALIFGVLSLKDNEPIILKVLMEDVIFIIVIKSLSQN